MKKIKDCVYSLTGEVIHGMARGRTVGMPTANMDVPIGIPQPPKGVFTSLIELDGKTYKGLTNIGTRPTVDTDSTIKFETHIFDFSDDIYGKIITVRLCGFVRPEKRFDSLQEVQHQVKKDMETAKRIFKDWDCPT